jgi:hypothetical protein
MGLWHRYFAMFCKYNLMKKLFYVSLVLFASCQSRMFTQGNQNNMDGWHFRVCTDETKASRVWFEISGTTDRNKYKSTELKWTSGKNNFIAVPESLRYLDDLSVLIKTSGKRKARICILYGDYIVDSMEVSGTESQKLSKKNRDDCPC